MKYFFPYIKNIWLWCMLIVRLFWSKSGFSYKRLQIRKKENVLFNDALIAFLLTQLYGVGHMIKNHSNSERGNPLPPLHGLLIPISSKGSLYAPSNRQDSTYHDLCYTSRGALAGTKNNQWVHHEGSIRRPVAP